MELKITEKWYHTKDTFTERETKTIGNLIDNLELDTNDIKEFIMYYIYNRLERDYPNKWDNEDIWKFTAEHTSNGLTGKENYKNLIKYLTKK